MPPPRSRPQVSALEGRAVPAALLQVINDSPYPPAAAVDVYINNLLVPELTGLPFRKGTPYLTQPSAVPLVVSVRTAGATAATVPLLTQTFNLAENSATVAVALGDPTQPQTALTRFQLLATPAARTQAAIAGRAEFSFVHGSPDAPPVDVKVRGVGVAADNAAYAGLVPGYTSLAPGKYPLDVTLADGVTRVGSYSADLTGSAGKALTVLASGFVGNLPAGVPEANRFGLLAVNSDGTASLLPATSPPALGTSFAAGANGFTAGVYTAGGQPTIVPAASASAGRTQERVAVADVDGDGQLDLVTSSGPGTATLVTVSFGGAGGRVLSVQPFEASFTGGVFVAAADLDGDGKAEVVVTPDQGGGPVVAVYSGAKLAAGVPAEIARFLGIEDAGFRGGARAAVGDVNGDGTPDLVVAAGFGGGPRVAVYNGKTILAPVGAGQVPPRLVADFFVFEPTLRNGVFVAAGDVNGDGAADVLVGGGPGGGPRVFGLSGAGLVAGKQVTVADFFAGDPNNRDGVRLVAKDLDGDLNADLVVGLGAAGTAQVRGYRGKDFAASVTGTTPPAVGGLDLNPFANPGLVYVG